MYYYSRSIDDSTLVHNKLLGAAAICVVVVVVKNWSEEKTATQPHILACNKFNFTDYAFPAWHTGFKFWRATSGRLLQQELSTHSSQIFGAAALLLRSTFLSNSRQARRS